MCVMVCRKAALWGTASGLVDKSGILELRVKAIRAGVWFRGLRRIDRALIDLTIKVVSNNAR